MATPLEVTKQEFYTSSYNLYNTTDDLVLEDCQFILFTELLDDSGIFKNPKVCRKRNLLSNSYWSLIGYSYDSFIFSDNESGEENIEDEDEITDQDILYQYTIFNGFFSDKPEIENAQKAEIDKALRETIRFIENTFSGDYINDFHDARDLQEHLSACRNNDKLDRIDICIVTDKLINQENLPTSHRIFGTDLNCRIYYWDIKKWNDLKRSKEQRISIDIDFNDEEYSLYKVKYVKQNRSEISTFLAYFPGDLIADLYDYHSTRLLENNVRVFLSANRKANKSIRETIANQPELFFSFNNGLSATATAVKCNDNYIESIEDFQIVNGGQTTATIHYAKKKDKSPLTYVFVPVKITSLRKDENYSNIVSEIARAANTQTAIKSSDFYANNPLLIRIEQLALRNPIEDENQRFVYCFFERMSGQYNVSKNSQGTSRNIRAWIRSHPKQLLFNKIDVARSFNCMQLKPNVAASSAEKQFVDFMKKNEYKNLNVNQFKDLFGFGLLFKRTRKLIGTKNGNEYPSIIGDSSVAMATTIYSMSYLQFISEEQFNYHLAYESKGLINSLIQRERLDTEFDTLLISIIKSCWSKLAEYGGTSVQEQSKRAECWEYVKNNIQLPQGTLQLIQDLKLSEGDIKARSRIDEDDEHFYFTNLNELLFDNAKLLKSLYQISLTHAEFSFEKNILKNFIRRIENGSSTLTFAKVMEIMVFYDQLNKNAVDISEFQNSSGMKIPSIRLNLIYERLFENVSRAKDKIDERTLALVEDKGDEVLNKEARLKSIIEEYYSWPGLSLEKLAELDSLIDYFQI
ncbi:AIPR family protein [Fulvivirga sedimenti]|uniref:AIPR family protein n=1 Tax=Fulvivirga sedimenti TaxID=2879465 RepID=A0A9X1HRS7_9BACT|nr:AIPR family protein [Fulvivirga sedimenti]MCA6075597.1 AIPR family protein [Fulvivirga sedimenti]